MKVTVCQIDPSEDQRELYFDGLMNHVSSQQSEFVLLPEMCFSEWLAADEEVDLERWSKAIESHSQMISKLGDLGARAVVGTRPVIVADGSRRNEAYLWAEATREAIGIHEKYYLPEEEGYWEATWYSRGRREFEPAKVGDLFLGVQICTEMWFFEWARHYASAGVDVLCVPRATPHGSTDKWLAGGQAAAICSGAYCLSANLWYPPGSKADCGGLSWVVDPEGEILATTDPDNPFATVDIELSYAKESKLTYPRYVSE